MNASHPEWILVADYVNAPGCPRPAAALRGWLRDRGIDWMPFTLDEVECRLSCGIDAAGRRQGWYGVRVRADALWRLGLHPDQPTAAVRAPSRRPVSASRRRGR
ncbi:hypothetical protein [Streptomyces odontomachi]|uniref:hypothetical protein n=1 Tax=Streptomyces odontomachi TaxID=2944940 RepID=UPI0027E248BC|nr:hypothetical protein [Streptomyces sp. ODS25]